jgi:hypothetical protein
VDNTQWWLESWLLNRSPFLRTWDLSPYPMVANPV